MSALRLRMNGNRLSYSEQFTETLNLLHLMLIQNITLNTKSSSLPFSEELHLQIENEVYCETCHD